jgi:N-acetylmuramoyl-L-alanine amidase
MIIHDYLLHSSTGVMCGTASVGELVAATGKKMLWSARRDNTVDVVVIHYMSAVVRFPDNPFALEHIIAIFCDYGVSSHFVIDRDGKVFRLVPEVAKAWHCGGSLMPEPDNRENVNEFSIGIELLATHQSGFTDKQYSALGALCKNIEEKKEREMTYVGHEDVAGQRAVKAGLRTDRKIDPGPCFDWIKFKKMLAERRGNKDHQLPI